MVGLSMGSSTESSTELSMESWCSGPIRVRVGRGSPRPLQGSARHKSDDSFYRDLGTNSLRNFLKAGNYDNLIISTPMYHEVVPAPMSYNFSS